MCARPLLLPPLARGGWGGNNRRLRDSTNFFFARRALGRRFVGWVTGLHP